MAETIEQLMIRLGYDASQVDRGTLAMLDKQKKAAMDYVDFWKSALVKRDADDAAMNDKSIARARAAAKERIEIRRQEMAAYAAQNEANREISAGSGGFGWVGVGSNDDSSGGGHGGGHGGNANILRRESLVLVHELVRGNYSRMASSAMILLGAMGGMVTKLIQSLIGPFGIALGAIGYVAFSSYEKIKEFNKVLDEMGKLNKEAIGDRLKATHEVMMDGIKATSEFEGKLKALRDVHVSLAEAAEKAARAIEKEAEAQGKLTESEGNFRISQINLAEHLGMISKSQASAARASIGASIFTQQQGDSLNALKDQGGVISGSLSESYARRVALENAGRLALQNLTGLDSSGKVINHAAFARNVQLKQRTNIEDQIKKQQEMSGKLQGTIDDESTGVYSSMAKTLSVGGRSLLPSWTLNAYVKQKEGLDAVIKKEQEMLKAQDHQNEENIKAQQDAMESYKHISKQLDENAESLKKLNEDMKDWSDKYKDQSTAMRALYTNLQSQYIQNQAAQIAARSGMDTEHPTIEMLAGRSFMSKLNTAYGPATYKWKKINGQWFNMGATKGQYDLDAGDGPFSKIAQAYELSQRQQMFDIIHGNGGYDENGNLYGQALADKNRSTQLRSMLGNAGIDTPQMQMASLIENGEKIFNEISGLRGVMERDGIAIRDSDGTK